MYVDLVLTDDAGDSFLVDTKYKVLGAEKQHGGLSQADFYQMYAYGSAGKRHYNDIVLLYPTTAGIQSTFHQGDLRLHVRQFGPRGIYNPESGGSNEATAVNKLSRALSNVRPIDSIATVKASS